MIHYYHRLAGFLFPPLLFFASLFLVGAGSKPSGADPYVPTAQEWLAIQWNSTQLRSWTSDMPFHLYALPGGNPNEIQLVLHYTRYPGKEDLHEARELAFTFLAGGRKVLDSLAKIHGFDSWLVVREIISHQEENNESREDLKHHMNRGPQPFGSAGSADD